MIYLFFFFIQLNFPCPMFVVVMNVMNCDNRMCCDDVSHSIGPAETYHAEFAHTTRGREQLIFLGQPFVYEKQNTLPNGEIKKLWRCNQWWNKRCRARVFTINNIVSILNKYHTHEEIIKRKKRVAKKKDKSNQQLIDQNDQTGVIYLFDEKKENTSLDEQFVNF